MTRPGWKKWATLLMTVPLLQTTTVVCDVPTIEFVGPAYVPYDYVVVEETVYYDEYYYEDYYYEDYYYGSFWDYWWF